MQSYDGLMLLLLGSATVLGALRGMAWQIASLASIVVSSAVAVRFCDRLALQVTGSPTTNRLLTMVALFLATSFVIWLLFRLASSAIDKVRLQGFDRQVGALMGAVKGAVLCLIVTFFAVTMSDRTRQHVRESRSGHVMAVLLDRGEPLLPESVRDALGGYLDQLNEGLDPTADPLPTNSAHRATERENF